MYYKGKKYDLTLHDVVSKDKSKALRILSPNYYRDMADRMWETHEVAVGILNSLNAIYMLPQYKKKPWPYGKDAGSYQSAFVRDWKNEGI